MADCHIEREHQNISYSSVLEKPRIDNVNTNNNNNNRTLILGTSFSGDTYLLLKILSRMRDRFNYKITQSPHEQYPNSKNKIKDITDEITPLNEYENATIVFDDISGSSNSKKIDQFFLRGKKQ